MIPMEKEHHILDQVEKTMQAFDQMPTLEPDPYLFTRLRAKLVSHDIIDHGSILKKINLKPIALSLIIILNILTALYVFAEKEKSLKDQLVSSLSQEYNSTENDTLLEK
jgi:hypothetical protein